MLRQLFYYFPFLKKFFTFFLPRNIFLKREFFKSNFLKDYIYSFYDENSIKEKRFYNIGAGNQRSMYNMWTYLDLKDSQYNKNNIDLFFDLEKLSPMPIQNDCAEVVFSSFVVEHISNEATKNYCNEAYRVLKKGGVFHTKVHSYEYSYRLLKKGILSPKIPFDSRESQEIINKFLRNNHCKVIAFFNKNKEYVIQSKINPLDQIIFSPEDGFLYHNAVAAIDNMKNSPNGIKNTLNMLTKKYEIKEFYNTIKENYLDPSKKHPHQHNADYFSQEELYEYIKSVGFSEVYFTQPFQSVSPVLWEKKLNNIHDGFLFSIEAIK